MARFAFSYGAGMRTLLALTGMPAGATYVETGPAVVTVRAGVWFRLEVPRDRIVRVQHCDRRVFSRGVHGWRGRWLVNGSSDGLVRIEIEPATRGRLAFVPLRVREVTVSLEDPDGFVATLTSRTSRGA